MAFFDWSTRYETGIPEIDAQHKTLVKLTNTLAEASASKTPDELAILNRAMVELSDYIKVHFSTEERLLVQSHYPDLQDHILGHRDFERQFKDLLQQAMGGQLMGVDPLLDFLKPWLADHILQSDQNFAAHMKTGR